MPERQKDTMEAAEFSLDAAMKAVQASSKLMLEMMTAKWTPEDFAAIRKMGTMRGMGGFCASYWIAVLHMSGPVGEQLAERLTEMLHPAFGGAVPVRTLR